MNFREEFPDRCATARSGGRPVFRASLLFFPLFLAVAVAESSFAVAGLVTAAFLTASVAHAFATLIWATITRRHVTIDLAPCGPALRRISSASAEDGAVGSAVAGLVGNAIAACACVAAVAEGSTAMLVAAGNPFAFPRDDGGVVHSFALLTLHANLVQAALAAVPVPPFAAGRAAESAISRRFGTRVASNAVARLGVVTGVCLAWIGVACGNAWLTLAGTAAVAVGLTPIARPRRDAIEVDPADLQPAGAFATTALATAGETRENWWARRRRRKAENAAARDAEDDVRLDGLLEKVHRDGLDSLSAAERRFLKRSSSRYRS